LIGAAPGVAENALVAVDRPKAAITTLVDKNARYILFDIP